MLPESKFDQTQEAYNTNLAGELRSKSISDRSAIAVSRVDFSYNRG